ncbi:MAG: hypothetical protein U5K38_11530 [Woeseiaceae bacterium]|nr:hypothetical protein [Woeseiaceae bacterium]
MATPQNFGSIHPSTSPSTFQWVGIGSGSIGQNQPAMPIVMTMRIALSRSARLLLMIFPGPASLSRRPPPRTSRSSVVASSMTVAFSE